MDMVYKLFAAAIQDGYVGNLIDIVKMAGGEEELYKKDYDSLKALGLSHKMAGHIINTRNNFDFDKIMGIIKEHKITFLRYDDESFPKRLLNIESCPYGIFVKGELPKDNSKSIAIVGARDCSDYGRLMAEYFGDRLARAGIDIISGMAYGIDGIAQMAAINANGKSIAVLGCGVDVIYPLGNRKLYNRLVSGGGGVISEFVPGTKAISRNFPPRNRIISGLCDALLVVEAKAKSGTLITADLANDQGKEVMVLPGRLTDPLSIGCINLIKQGASPVTGTEDIISRIYPDLKVKGKKKKASVDDTLDKLSENEKKVIDVLDYYPKSLDELSESLKIDFSDLCIILTKLELEGLLKSTSPGHFCKSTL